MARYHQMGTIPQKRHSVFRKEDQTLYREQVMGTKGFSGIQSILYHQHPPTQFFKSSLFGHCSIEFEEPSVLRPRHFYTDRVNKKLHDAVMGREYILGNEDLFIGVVNPTESMEYFYRNSNGDELLFVHRGTGKIESIFGTLHYQPGDYLVIPIGTIYRIEPTTEDSKFLVIETNSWITTPKRYRNEFGQLLEHSPFCERDIHGPEKLVTHTEQGEYEVRTKSGEYLHSHFYEHHPLDVVGWDGFLYPWKLNIADFEPITGRIHQPPPVHQTFEGHNFVVCSFVPRLYDYHPEAIPAPFYHSNIDSDEVLYYVEGNFMSRKGIQAESLTLHPAGIPHGPHPGKVEESIGKKETFELAVMIDTFRPLKVVQTEQQLEDGGYQYSWLEKR
ncbi:homogentisate 1,2-dioxygenase [Rubeoparvulum massiliense]|uniref:homogentisate 1,2-dioxygenase n=1 Tax=Rubeoparvulum massiliense TaxID=1631346 RepID=UPI00065E88DF|nr:homogentisate 1,2-dioxygenase [Rubeoparvulum massiliense]